MCFFEEVNLSPRHKYMLRLSQDRINAFILVLNSVQNPNQWKTPTTKLDKKMRACFSSYSLSFALISHMFHDISRTFFDFFEKNNKTIRGDFTFGKLWQFF